MTIARDHVNLLYITAGETSYYVLMQDLSRLVSSQYNNHHGKHYFCQYCLHGCTRRGIEKPYGKMQVTRTTKNQAPRS